MTIQHENETVMVLDSGPQFLEILTIIGSVIGLILVLIFYYFIFYIVYKLYLKARKW